MQIDHILSELEQTAQMESNTVFIVRFVDALMMKYWAPDKRTARASTRGSSKLGCHSTLYTTHYHEL